MTSAEPEGAPERQLRMYGGAWAGAIPLAIMVAVMVWLSIAEKAAVEAFWVGGVLAIIVGLLIARTKGEYSLAVLRGLGNRSGIVIIAAFIFAGVFGQLMVTGGLVEGLLWFGLETGVQGALFTGLAFVAAMIFAVATGTSVGTVVSLIPVLYPAGVFLGADPMMLGAAVLSGAAFGDNLAPVSDTTIVSAYTQDAKMGDVVRTRFPLAISAAALSLPVLLIFGGGHQVRDLPELEADSDPTGLLILGAVVVVIVSSVYFGRHVIESLIWGSLSAAAIALVSGTMSPGDLFRIPEERGDSTGAIQDGIDGVTGAIVFVLLILAVTQVLIETGIMDRVLRVTERHAAKSVRQAELTSASVTMLATIPLSTLSASMFLVGPTLVKPLGQRFNLAPARRANLMDCSANSLFYMMPWHNAVIVWYATLQTAAESYDLPLPSIYSAFANPYSWAILLVILVSILTGWNRKYDVPGSPREPAGEQAADG
ncbi:MAG: sodium:proton antiporter [Pseudonocardiaceae bacterium]|nr:sodium:proton antiporter [Pseudonocardiaceae bacterium]